MCAEALKMMSFGRKPSRRIRPNTQSRPSS